VKQGGGFFNEKARGCAMCLLAISRPDENAKNSRFLSLVMLGICRGVAAGIFILESTAPLVTFRNPNGLDDPPGYGGWNAYAKFSHDASMELSDYKTMSEPELRPQWWRKCRCAVQIGERD